jgi:hypothetical protein
VDQSAPARPLATSGGNGLADRVAVVEAARERLGRDLDQLHIEARAEIGQKVERIVWKVAAAGAVLVAGLAVRKALTAAWQAARDNEPPTDPADPRASWGEALGWTVATAVGMGVAKVVATRGAAAGWQKATGQPPPT